MSPDDIQHMSAPEARDYFQEISETGRQPEPLRPRKLPRDALKICPALFHPRGHDAFEQYQGRELLEELTAFVERGSTLDPLTVWWSGEDWFVIDGHLRLLAYDEAKFRKRIPVDVFEGTTQEATLEATRANAKNKLLLSKPERMEATWRITLVYPELSKTRVHDATKAGNGTIGEMRRVRELLYKAGDTAEGLLELGWTGAQLKARDAADHEWSEDMQAQKVARLKPHVAAAFGGALNNDPEVAALVLIAINPRLPERFSELEAWADIEGDFDDPDADY